MQPGWLGAHVSIETIFDIIQTPVIGVIVGLVLYFQLRKQEGIQRPVLWALAGGILTAALYGAWKFLL